MSATFWALSAADVKCCQWITSTCGVYSHASAVATLLFIQFKLCGR